MSIYNSSAFDQRDAQRARLNATNVQVVRTSGFVTTTGSGEGLVDVVFRRTYIEKPAISCGGELDPTSPAVVTGSYPTANVVVVSWVSTTSPGGVVHYTGAKLAIVTTGDSAQVLIVHWQVEGKALASP